MYFIDFTVELRAILLALELIFISDKSQFLIYNDLLSRLQTLKAGRHDNLLVVDISEYFRNLMTWEKSIDFYRVTCHIRIDCKERADRAAKVES